MKDPDDDSSESATLDRELDGGSTVGLWGALVRAARGLERAELAQLLARAPALCNRAQYV